MNGVILYLLVSLAVGAMFLFRGKQLFFPLLMLAVFLAVFAICTETLGYGPKGLIFGLIASIFVAALTKFFYKAGVFLLCAVGGMSLGSLLCTMVPALAPYRTAVIVVAAVAVGIVAVIWCEILIMLSTAFSGGALVASTGCFLVYEYQNLSGYIDSAGIVETMQRLGEYISGDFSAAHGTVILIATLVLTLFGFLSQKRAG